MCIIIKNSLFSAKMEVQVDYALLLHTAERRTTTNLKTKNNQNCQKTELYGILTTEQLKRKYSSRPVGNVETGSWNGEDKWQGNRTDKVRQQLLDQKVPHYRVDKLGGTTGD